jgi:hypothetical protein
MCYICSARSGLNVSCKRIAYVGPLHPSLFLTVRIEMKAKAKDHKPVSAVITVPDPDNSPFTVHVEVGGTLQWRSDSYNYPHFEVEFIGANPANKKLNAKFAGGNLKPVVIPLKTTGDYLYNIRHQKKNGPVKSSGPSSARVVPCTGCPP